MVGKSVETLEPFVDETVQATQTGIEYVNRRKNNDETRKPENVDQHEYQQDSQRNGYCRPHGKCSPQNPSAGLGGFCDLSAQDRVDAESAESENDGA